MDNWQDTTLETSCSPDLPENSAEAPATSSGGFVPTDEPIEDQLPDESP